MHIPRSLLLLAVCAAAPLTAQGVNCTLLGTFNNHGPFNDVWGYTAPNGSEYALLGTTTGTVVVDVTNPASPVERGFFPWAASGWRDIRTYGQYAYVGTEAGQGFQILNLSAPNNPSVVGVVGAGNSNNSHNVCVDVGAGRLYLAGCNTGTPVYDLAANPTNPPFLGFAYGSGNSNYYHDLCVENGYGYGSMIYNGDLRIFDVSTFPPTTLSDSNTPGSFTHNAWPNAAGTLCVTTDEVTGGVVRFWDITNKNNPVGLGTFTPNPNSIPHNAYIIGNLCHVSWYTEGYRCLDISDPSNPVEVASYDTWPGGSGGFSGAWGCYPFLPSGNILVSDRATGLYIVKPNLTTLALSHTPLVNTANEDGPYDVDAIVTTNQALGNVTLNWRVVGSGSFTTVAMTPTGQPDEYRASIPGHDAVTEIEYYIEADDVFGTVRSPQVANHTFLIGTINELFFDDFESDLGWTHSGFNDDWERGSPTGQAGTSAGTAWQDPSSAFSGNNVFGNDLGNGTNGAYDNGTSCTLQSPVIPTNGLQNLRLRFRRWLEVAPGDIATVRVNGVVVYVTVVGQNDGGWQDIDIDLAPITNAASQFQISFVLQTNGSGVSGGWAIDDVLVTQTSDSSPPQLYGVGTAGGTGVPTIGLSQPACIGATPLIEAGGAPANAATFLLLNYAPDNNPVFGITALVANPAVTELRLADGSGDVGFPFAVPNDPFFDNLYLFSQIIPVDPAGPMGLSATQGMRFRICLQ